MTIATNGTEVYKHIFATGTLNKTETLGVIEPLDGVITLQLPQTTARAGDYSCFAANDLHISNNGTVTLVTDKPMFVRALSNPPKIALITKRVGN